MLARRCGSFQHHVIPVHAFYDTGIHPLSYLLQSYILSHIVISTKGRNLPALSHSGFRRNTGIYLPPCLLQSSVSYLKVISSPPTVVGKRLPSLVFGARSASRNLSLSVIPVHAFYDTGIHPLSYLLQSYIFSHIVISTKGRNLPASCHSGFRRNTGIYPLLFIVHSKLNIQH